MVTVPRQSSSQFPEIFLWNQTDLNPIARLIKSEQKPKQIEPRFDKNSEYLHHTTLVDEQTSLRKSWKKQKRHNFLLKCTKIEQRYNRDNKIGLSIKPFENTGTCHIKWLINIRPKMQLLSVSPQSMIQLLKQQTLGHSSMQCAMAIQVKS